MKMKDAQIEDIHRKSGVLEHLLDMFFFVVHAAKTTSFPPVNRRRRLAMNHQRWTKS
jgi:hypothetical protein